jgi:hypothetical protein
MNRFAAQAFAAERPVSGHGLSNNAAGKKVNTILLVFWYNAQAGDF